MVRPIAVLAATLLLTSVLPTPAQAPLDPGTLVIQAGTQLVTVDVIVRDAGGKPIHGLKAADFQLEEGKNPQSIHSFEEHTPVTAPARSAAVGSMLPGTFTNYTPVPPGGALNVLLVDTLNTPLLAQGVLHEQLKKYIKQAHPGDRIAIFGLTDRLLLLQGFTSDPETLKSAIDHKFTPHTSHLLNEPVGSGADSLTRAEEINGTDELAANVAQFDAQTAEIQNTMRLEDTLEAFNSLARYLSAFAGRKNLLWFSGSFPINPSNQNVFHRTASLLARAQIAVYPIDARGLMVNSLVNPANPASNAALTARNPAAMMAAYRAFGQGQFEDHSTMDALAFETGGKAFYNTNGLTQATHEAIDIGSSYYTLTYVPTDRNWNHAYRSIHVALTDAPHDLKLTYRPGYFADPPRRLKPIDPAATASQVEAAAAMQHGALTYDRASMARGAPTPEDVLFKVRVVPTTGAAETVLARDNTLDPATPVKGPFHRYSVDYALLPTAITLQEQSNGNHAGQLKFTVYVYDRDGKMLVAAHRNFNLNLKPDLYPKFIQAALQCHMEVSIPDSTETYLRIGIEDVPADHFGAVEVATASVSHLPPAASPKPPTP